MLPARKIRQQSWQGELVLKRIASGRKTLRS
jgi:hypothetical protein